MTIVATSREPGDAPERPDLAPRSNSGSSSGSNCGDRAACIMCGGRLPDGRAAPLCSTACHTRALRASDEVASRLFTARNRLLESQMRLEATSLSRRGERARQYETIAAYAAVVGDYEHRLGEINDAIAGSARTSRHRRARPSTAA